MVKQIDYNSNRGQGVFLVLYSLLELGAGAPSSKQEVLGHIKANKYYEISQCDLPPYKSQNEPRFETLLCWARKDALQNEWLLRHDEIDHWQLSRDGVSIINASKAKFSSGKWSVRNCYLWTAKFKLVIDPTYSPSEKDKVRPPAKGSLLSKILEEYDL